MAKLSAAMAVRRAIRVRPDIADPQTFAKARSDSRLFALRLRPSRNAGPLPGMRNGDLLRGRRQPHEFASTGFEAYGPALFGDGGLPMRQRIGPSPTPAIRRTVGSRRAVFRMRCPMVVVRSQETANHGRRVRCHAAGDQAAAPSGASTVRAKADLRPVDRGNQSASECNDDPNRRNGNHGSRLKAIAARDSGGPKFGIQASPSGDQ